MDYTLAALTPTPGGAAVTEYHYTCAIPRPPQLLTEKQLADIAKILTRINQEHNGFGTVTIIVKRGQVAGIGATTEWRYDLEPK